MKAATKTAQYTIFLFGRTTPEMEELTNEIYRSKEIVNKYRNEPDQEVKEYCAGQTDRANRLAGELQRLIKRSLLQGSFLFRGELTAVETLNQDLIEAARKHLASVAEQAFDRYNEAPVRAGTDLAEKFLRLGNLTGVTSQLDPLNLVQTQGGRPSINTDHKAITSIRDMIERQGSIEGKTSHQHLHRCPLWLVARHPALPHRRHAGSWRNQTQSGRPRSHG